MLLIGGVQVPRYAAPLPAVRRQMMPSKKPQEEVLCCLPGPCFCVCGPPTPAGATWRRLAWLLPRPSWRLAAAAAGRRLPQSAACHCGFGVSRAHAHLHGPAKSSNTRQPTRIATCDHGMMPSRRWWPPGGVNPLETLPARRRSGCRPAAARAGAASGLLAGAGGADQGEV